MQCAVLLMAAELRQTTFCECQKVPKRIHSPFEPRPKARRLKQSNDICQVHYTPQTSDRPGAADAQPIDDLFGSAELRLASVNE